MTPTPAGEAVAAAVRVAARLGLGDPIDPVILREGANLTVHLRPYPVVARVATVTAEVRAVEAYQRRELAVLEHLARAGAASVRPAASVPAGTHEDEVDGLRLILLRFYDHDPARVLPGELIGESLVAVHHALLDLDLALPHCAEAVEEVPSLLDRAGEVLRGADREFLDARAREVAASLRGYRGPVRPLHGDVHLGNLLRTPTGPVWADFEDAGLGPVEWDLASLLASTEIITTHRDLAGAALRRYGVDRSSAVWRSCLEGNMLIFTAWAALAAGHNPRAAATMPRRVAWLRRHADG